MNGSLSGEIARAMQQDRERAIATRSVARRARASFRYHAFVPDEVAGFDPVVPFEVADLSADAEAAIRVLNERASVGGLEAVGPLLLRSEAVASSPGRVNGKRLAAADSPAGQRDGQRRTAGRRTRNQKERDFMAASKPATSDLSTAGRRGLAAGHSAHAAAAGRATAEQAVEKLARPSRIGRNELSVIQVCLAIVDAEREYAAQDAEADGNREYAHRFVSTAGKRDGLY
jgi:hypothetical protein